MDKEKKTVDPKYRKLLDVMFSEEKDSSDTSVKYKLHNRDFINLPGYHSVGALYYNVDVYLSSEDLDIDADLVISDCNRTVTLDFSVNEYSADAENSLYKINLLYDKIGEFKDKLTYLTSLRRQLKDEIKDLDID